MRPISKVIDLPISPLRSTIAEGDLHDAPVVATLMDGKTITGRLTALDGPQATVTLAGRANNRVYIEFSQLRHLDFLSNYPINNQKHPLEDKPGEVLMPSELQDFRIVFSDEKVLSGRTRGSFVDDIGIHLFQLVGTDRVSRLFIPARVVRKYNIGNQKSDDHRSFEARQSNDPSEVGAGHRTSKLTLKRRKSDTRGGKAAVRDLSQLQRKLATDSQEAAPGELHASKQIGEMLIEDGIITAEQLSAALATQKRDSSKRLGEILVGMGTVSSDEIFTALAHKFGMPFVLLRNFFIDISCLSLVPEDVARKYYLVPLMLAEDRLVIAMDDPANMEAVTLLRFMTHYKIEPTIATRDDITWAINKYYGKSDPDPVAEITSLASAIRQRIKPAERSHDKDQPSMARAVSSFVGNTIADAIDRNASDIHLIPAGNYANLMFRIDGKLIPVRRISRILLPSIISRLAVMGNMTGTQGSGPQQGRACMLGGDSAIELRITINPERYPEGAIIHVLNAVTRLQTISDIGLDFRDAQALIEMLSKNYSMLVVTGPENSGKTLTLYAALRELRTMKYDIATVETPVRYYMNGIHQIQGKDISAAFEQLKGLNATIVMIDDLHNPQALQSATELALDGKLVLGKLHAVNAARAVRSLIDAGIQPSLLNSTLIGVLAQHLLHLNCLFCAEEEQIDAEVRERLGVDDDEVFYRGSGCAHCNHTGYSGEQAVFELMPISTEIHSLINSRSPAGDIDRQAVGEGMISLSENALHLARMRKTSLAEVNRLAKRLDDDLG